MGRKIDLKKIEDITKCQVTFSKRRSSLMKKANEVAVCCDVDVAFVAFSPSGRISKFCNQKRIEDVIHRYIDLPADKRLNHISNIQEKMEKLGQLEHIKGDTSKLHYLDKQIENLELQIKKSGLELQILEADLRDYEVGPEQEPSLHQLTWCERNLNNSLQRVIARKDALVDKSSASYKQPTFQEFNPMDQMELEGRDGIPFPSNFNENEQISTIENPYTGQILMQLDPWISPFSARFRETIFLDLYDQAKYTTNEKFGPSNIPNFPIPSNMCNFPILDAPNIIEPEIILTSDAQFQPSHIPLQQSLMVDEPLLNFHEQNNINPWINNTSSVIVSDAILVSSQSSCNIQGPRFTSVTTVTTNASRAELPQSLYDQMGTGLQCANSNLNQFINMDAQDQIGQLNKDCNNGNTIRNDNIVDDEDCCKIFNSNEIHISDIQSEAPYNVHQDDKEVCKETQFDNFLPEGNLEEDTVWTSKVQKSGLWEWEDLLLDDNFDSQDLI